MKKKVKKINGKRRRRFQKQVYVLLNFLKRESASFNPSSKDEKVLWYWDILFQIYLTIKTDDIVDFMKLEIFQIEKKRANN